VREKTEIVCFMSSFIIFCHFQQLILKGRSCVVSEIVHDSFSVLYPSLPTTNNNYYNSHLESGLNKMHICFEKHFSALLHHPLQNYMVCVTNRELVVEEQIINRIMLVAVDT
jgi:hypothetical protein